MSADELTNDLGTKRLPIRGIFKTTHWATQDNARLHKNLQSELHVFLQGQRAPPTHTHSHSSSPPCTCRRSPLPSYAPAFLGSPNSQAPCTDHFREGTKETGDSAHLANLISLILMFMSLQLRKETCIFKEIETCMHTQTHILEPRHQSRGSRSFPGTPGSWTWRGWTHPVLEVTAPILQQLLELDGAVGHEVVVAYRSIMKDSQLDLAPIAHISDELIVPGRAVGLLLGGCLADARIVHVESNVGVQKESLWPGSHRMA